MTEKLDMTSPDLVSHNIERIAALFPNCVTETAGGKAIDFDLLRQELSTEIVEGPKERYRLEWPGKREAIVTANMPTTNTLRPVREDSVNFDTTENLYIEGDNLEVLKLLQESYLGKVKMIYIDPPYNTGSDFVYRDNFAQDAKEFKQENGFIDEQGNRMVTNLETAGRYHSDWLSMMYPRLKLARNLLTDDGVIFISIDDHEVHNIRKICDEVFGEMNFVSSLIWNKQHSQQQGLFKKYHEYVLLYTKNIISQDNISGGEGLIDAGALKKVSKGNPKSEFSFPTGVRFDAPDKYSLVGEFGDSEKVEVISGRLIAQNGKTFEEVTLAAGWTQKEQMKKYFKGEEVLDSKGQKVLEFYFNSKGKLKCLKERSKITPSTMLPQYGMVSEQTSKLIELLNGNYFDNPKPIRMLSDFMSWFCCKNDIVLDFFSGSSTTAHAMMELNAEDGGNRKFIMAQLSEKTDKKSEAFKDGYKNICEIGKERIRCAGAKIIKIQEIASQKIVDKGASLFDNVKESKIQKPKLDIGFRVYRLDTSNMQDVYYRPQDYRQELMTDLFANHIKTDRTADDLVAQVMLDWGLPLSLPIEQTKIAGKTVYKVDGNALYCCFDEHIDHQFAKLVAAEKPLRIVFHDYAFVDDTAKENVRQLLKQLSGDTEMKVV